MKDWQKILLFFGAWLIVIYGWVMMVTSNTWLEFRPTYPGWEDLKNSGAPTWLARLNGFDGFHYYTIAVKGYRHAALIQAFFPIYPLLIVAVTVLTKSALWSSVTISVIATVIMLILLYQEMKIVAGRKAAWWLVAIMLFLPTSFYLVSGYNEAVFLLWLVLAWRNYRKKNYWWTAFFCALLSATRIVGVILPFALNADYVWQKWQQNHALTKTDWSKIATLLLGVAGLFAYMFYLWQTFADPLYFMTVQSQFGAGRQTTQLVLLPQVIYRYLKMFIIGLPFNWQWWTTVQEFVLSLIYGSLFLVIAWQNWRARQEIYPWWLWLFSIGAYLVPTLTGNFSSMPRYLLVCLVVPLFLARAGTKKPRLMAIIMVVSFLIMLMNLTLFVQGYFVA